MFCTFSAWHTSKQFCAKRRDRHKEMCVSEDASYEVRTSDRATAQSDQRLEGVSSRWRLDRFIVRRLIGRHAMQWFFFMAWFGQRTFVAPNPIPLGILADGNPIFRLLRLDLFLVGFFWLKLHPRIAIVRFLLNDLQRRRCGLGTKRVVHEAIHPLSNRVAFRIFQLPSLVSVEACPQLALSAISRKAFR